MIAVIVRASGKVLVCQAAKDDDTFGGYWEFPGGKREVGRRSNNACRANSRRNWISPPSRWKS